MRKILVVAILGIVACSSSQPMPAARGGDAAQPAGETPAFLGGDEFDAAVAVSVAEAEKASVDPHVEEHVDTIYVCPMHPDVTSHAPGKCPKCGMQLVPRRKS